MIMRMLRMIINMRKISAPMKPSPPSMTKIMKAVRARIVETTRRTAVGLSVMLYVGENL